MFGWKYIFTVSATREELTCHKETGGRPDWSFLKSETLLSQYSFKETPQTRRLDVVWRRGEINGSGGVGGRWRWDDGNSKNLGRWGTTESELVRGFHSWVFASKKKYIKDECFFYPSGVTVVKMTVQGAVLGPRRGLRVTYWVGVHVHVLLQERPSGWRWSALQRGCEERRRKLLKEKFDIHLMGKY